MPRSPRADEAGGSYRALNLGNLRATIFHKPEDYVAFERILYEALEIHKVELYSYLLMPNHYHNVLRPMDDGEMSRFMGWVGGTHTMRYHAHYHTSGMGHVRVKRVAWKRSRATACPRASLHHRDGWSLEVRLGQEHFEAGGGKGNRECSTRNLD